MCIRDSPSKAHHRLDACTVAGLQAGKAQLARVALEHHAPGNTDVLARLAIDYLFEVAPLRAHLGDRRGDRHRYRVRATAEVTLRECIQLVALFEANPLLLEDLFFTCLLYTSRCV